MAVGVLRPVGISTFPETTGPVAKVNGKYVNPKQGLPLANLWLTQMQALGLKPERFADSTGVLKSLLI